MQVTPDNSNQLNFLFFLILPSVTRTLDNSNLFLNIFTLDNSKHVYQYCRPDYNKLRSGNELLTTISKRLLDTSLKYQSGG